jgi:hypothetical protein
MSSSWLHDFLIHFNVCFLLRYLIVPISSRIFITKTNVENNKSDIGMFNWENHTDSYIV